jgi:hypothetical protein
MRRDVDMVSSQELRSLYWKLLNLELHPSCVEEVGEKLDDMFNFFGTSNVKLFRTNSVSSLVDNIPTLSTEKVLKKSQQDLARKQFALWQLAPLIRIEGSHLSGIIQLRDAATEFGAYLLRLHSRASGDGDLNDSVAVAFSQDMASQGITLPELHDSAFAFDPRVESWAFTLPLLLLGLSLFPRRYKAQILGVTLFFAEHITMSLFGNQSRCFRLQSANKSVNISNARSAILSCLDITTIDVENGYNAARTLYTHFLEMLSTTLQDEELFSPQGKFLSLLARFGSTPFGYHTKGKMGGKPIDYWFDPKNFCPGKVLQALAKSPYVVPGAPERSRLLTALTKPEGPMFRIFSDEDLDVIADWIKDLPADRNVNLTGITMPSPPQSPKKSEFSGKAREVVQKFNLREMYYQLINFDDFPLERERAYAYAQKWLADCGRNLKKAPSELPFNEYSHEGLDSWLEHHHAKQVSSYTPLTDCPEEAREDVVDTGLQLSPLTRIDGAWLRAFTSPAWVNTKVGGLLYHIYADELGNGNIKEHHGNIYRDLVKSMGFELAEFHQKAFADAKAFEDSSFEVPVFWLSISLFPRQFLPEILGLNLAMELSGVGGEYRRSGDVLAYYGYSSQFTALHNSIDNIITGHTAWAVSAIKSHMDDISVLGGKLEVTQHWHRRRENSL